jgi:NAD(P)-dependent dehydrogenase (short-subunit alcohol dehydrogenase family)
MIAQLKPFEMQLKDKVIIITGGSAGIGLKCAKVYHREGAKLAILSIGSKETESALQDLSGHHLGIARDVGNEEEVKSAVTETISYFGKIDAIHNNAGISRMDIFRVGNRLTMIVEADEKVDIKEAFKKMADLLRQKEWALMMHGFQQKIPFAKPNEHWVLMNQIFEL